MNTITESIPTVFNPETAFVLSLQSTDDKFNRADEAFTPRRFTLPTEDRFAERGIPQSAIHD
jgi:hypothetical protein